MLINWVAGGVFLQRTQLSNHRDLHIKHLTVLCHLYLDKAGKKKREGGTPPSLSVGRFSVRCYQFPDHVRISGCGNFNLLHLVGKKNVGFAVWWTHVSDYILSLCGERTFSSVAHGRSASESLTVKWGGNRGTCLLRRWEN